MRRNGRGDVGLGGLDSLFVGSRSSGSASSDSCTGIVFVAKVLVSVVLVGFLESMSVLQGSMSGEL